MGEDDTGPSLVGQVLDGRFEVLRPLATGGMGALWVAVQRPLGREVAVKVLHARRPDDTVERRFAREARVVASLRHSHIVTLFDFGTDEVHGPYLVMELLHGSTLRARLEDHGAFTERASLRILQGVAAGLAVAHEAGIAHRDLKPANIMLTDEGRRQNVPKLLDFGLARLATDKETGLKADLSLTDQNVILGTPGYVAPEAALGGVSGDPRSDLYSLGVIAFEMLTGKSPFTAENPVRLIVAHATKEPPRVREVAPDREIRPEVCDLVSRLLAKEPEGRPTAEELGAELDGLLSGLTSELVSFHPSTPSGPIRGLSPALPTEETPNGDHVDRGDLVVSPSPPPGESAAGRPSPSPATSGGPLGSRRLKVPVAATAVAAALLGAWWLGASRPRPAPKPAPVSTAEPAALGPVDVKVQALLTRPTAIFAAALSRDQERLAYTEAGRLLLRELASGETRVLDEGAAFGNASLDFLADGRVVVSGAPNLEHGIGLTLYDAEGEVTELTDDASSAVVSQDGARLAYARRGGIFVTEVSPFSPELVHQQERARPVAFSPDGRALVIADYVTPALLTATVDGREKRVLLEGMHVVLQTGEIYAAWPEPERLLVTTRRTSDHIATYFSSFPLPRGPLERLWSLPDAGLSASTFLPERRAWMVVATRASRHTHVAALGPERWDPRPLPGAPSETQPVSFLTDDLLLVRGEDVGDLDNLALVDLRTGTRVAFPSSSPDLIRRGQADLIALERLTDDRFYAGRYALVEQDEGYDLALLQEPVELPTGSLFVDCPTQEANPCLATAYQAGRLGLWAVEFGEGASPPREIASLITDRRTARISPDGTTVAVPHGDGFSVVDVASGTVRRVPVREPAGSWERVAWSADGRSLYGSVLGLEGGAHGVLESDLEGHAEVRWRSTEKTPGDLIISADGERVALRFKTFSSDVLLTEGWPVGGD